MSSLHEVFGDYWKAYGGYRALFSSPFFWLSIALTVVTSNYWMDKEWWSQSLSVIPNLLGFTLGGFAVFLGFGDEKFKSIIAGRDDDNPDEQSPYIEVCGAFMHFVLVQVAALISAIIANATAFSGATLSADCHGLLRAMQLIGSGVGYWLFLYGVSLSAAAAIAIFRVALWFDAFKSKAKDSD